MSSPDLQPPLSPDPFQESPLPDHSLAILRRLDREIERRASSWMQILELTVRDLADAFAHFNWTGVYLVEGDDLVLSPSRSWAPANPSQASGLSGWRSRVAWY